MLSPVDAEIYDGVAMIAGADYAFSYFTKAEHKGSHIRPYTVTAWERITGRGDVMRFLSSKGITLFKPDPWHEGRGW